VVKKRVTEQKQEVIEILHVDAFNTWLLLDYTRFTVARLRDIELTKLGITPEQAAILKSSTGTVVHHRPDSEQVDETASIGINFN